MFGKGDILFACVIVVGILSFTWMVMDTQRFFECEKWKEEMLDRGDIEYKIHPETNERILVDIETGEELDIK